MVHSVQTGRSDLKAPEPYWQRLRRPCLRSHLCPRPVQMARLGHLDLLDLGQCWQHPPPPFRQSRRYRRRVHSVPMDQMAQAPCLLRRRLQCLRSHLFRLPGLTDRMAHLDQ